MNQPPLNFFYCYFKKHQFYFEIWKYPEITLEMMLFHSFSSAKYVIAVQTYLPFHCRSRILQILDYFANENFYIFIIIFFLIAGWTVGLLFFPQQPSQSPTCRRKMKYIGKSFLHKVPQTFENYYLIMFFEFLQIKIYRFCKWITTNIIINALYNFNFQNKKPIISRVS